MAGNALFQLCQWGMLLVLARVGTSEMVGQYVFGLAVTAPIFLFTNLALRQLLATDARRDFRFGDYLGLRLTGCFAALVIVYIVLSLFSYRRETVLIVMAIAVAKGVEAVGDIFHGLFQNLERMDLIAKSLTFRGVLSLIGLTVGLVVSSNLLGGVVGLLLSTSITLWVHDVRHASGFFCADRSKGGIWSWPGWQLPEQVGQRMRPTASVWSLAASAVPLGLAGMIASINANLPRYFVERHLGAVDLGVWGAMAYILIAGALLVNGVGQAASPRLSRQCASGDTLAFRALLLKLVGFALAVGCGALLLAWICGSTLLSLLYGAEYANHPRAFTLLMGAGPLYYAASALNYALVAKRGLKSQLLSDVASGAFLAAVLAYTVPTMGLLGAAASLVLWSLVVFAAKALALYFQTTRAQSPQRAGWSRHSVLLAE